MISVIGATGNVGRALVRRLAEAGEEVVAISRRGGSDEPRVRHVKADVQALGGALAGTQATFLMVAGSGAGLDPRAVVASIAEEGVRRVVLLSSIGTQSRPEASSHEPLRRFELEVKRSGLAWTILRPGGFDSNALAWVPGVRAARTVGAPFADVALPLVDPDDIAAVAAEALRFERHAGAVYELTGPLPLTPREQAAALGEVLDAPIRFVELTRAQAAEAWRPFMPADVVETTLDALGTPNELEKRVSPDIARVLGRPAQPFRAWAERHAGAFR